jgi:hypothetical protein
MQGFLFTLDLVAKSITYKRYENYRELFITTFKVTAESIDNDYRDAMIHYGDTDKARADFVWKCFNEIIIAYSKLYSNNPLLYNQSLKDIYFRMATFLRHTGRNPNHVLKQAHFHQLKTYEIADRDSDFVTEIHLIANGCCDVCSKIDERITTISTELINQSLPPEDCNRAGGCSCCYAEITAIDERGRLLRKS